MKRHQKEGTGLHDLIGGNHGDPKPRHPDAPRWTLALCGCVLMLIAWWGPSIVTFASRLHPRIHQFVTDQARWFDVVSNAAVYGAGTWLGLTALGLIYALACAVFWRRYRVPKIRGSYHAIVLPKPQVGRAAATNTDPQSPHVFWDRLVGLIAAGHRRKEHPYLALELWGNPGGRVQWGMWIPDQLADQREPLRRLITADRPQARLVAAADPWEAALDQARDDLNDDGARWYSSALLTLATRDYYPLLADGLSLASTVAALRPSRDVYASGVSLVVMSAPAAWGRRLDQLVRRWRWHGRNGRRDDGRWKQETDEISIKAQQAHARTCVRVQVIARSQQAAERECRAIVQTLTSSRKRYGSGWEQGWSVRRRQRGRAHAGSLPADLRVRAPVPALPRVWPLFPLA
jgi:hypothetical protein